MPRLRTLKTNYANGELGERLTGRPELKQYANGAALLRNVIVRPQGGHDVRPGTEYTAAAAEKSAGVYSNVRMAEFHFSTTQVYMIVFTHLKATIYKNGVSQKVLTTVYTSDDLVASYDSEGNLTGTGISWEQDLDTMLVFHEDHPIQKIERQGGHTLWAIAEFALVNVQRYAFSDGTYSARYTGNTVTNPNALTSAPVTLSNIDDDDTTTYGKVHIATTWGSADADRIIFQVDLGAVQEIGTIEVTNSYHTAATDVYVDLLYSEDAVTWFSYGHRRLMTGTSAPGISWQVVKDIEARYIALAGETGKGAADYYLSGINVYSFDVGIDEQQTVFFANDSTTTEWEEGDTFSILIQDEESTNVLFDFDAELMRIRIADAIETVPSISTGDITVAVDQAATRGATFTVTFGGTSGERPWGPMFVNKVLVQNNTRAAVNVSVPGRRPGEPVWSAARGYPRCGLFWQERLWVAGSTALPHFLWATRSTTINDFNVELDLDDYGISVFADASDVPAILNIFSGRHLQIFTTTKEFYVPISEVDKVTPTNIVLRETSGRGSRAGLRVVELDGATIFLQRGAKSIREMLFAAGEELAYTASNLSLLSSHLILTPVSMALKQATTTEDADYLYLVNTDGTMTVVCSLRAEEVLAFTHWSTNGTFVDVVNILDDVFVMVRRTIDGVETNLIEKLNEDLLTDSAVYDFALGAPASTATVAHLGATDTVQALLDDVAQDEKAMAANVLTFERDAASKYEVGLKWPEVDATDNPGYIWISKTLPVGVQLQDGPVMGRKHRISEVTVRLFSTTALTLNNNDLVFRTLGQPILDVAITPFTGLKKLKGLRGWGLDQRITMGSTVPAKCGILSLSYGVAI